MSVRLAARRHTDADTRIQEAQAACEKAFEANDVDTYYYENERFHLQPMKPATTAFSVRKHRSCIVGSGHIEAQLRSRCGLGYVVWF